jgi:hypothetical protein
MASTERAVGASAATTEDVIEALRAAFGPRHEAAYEEGLDDFERVIEERFDVDRGEGRRIAQELEQAQVLRFFHASAGRNAEGPRVGLFDEPGEMPNDRPETEPSGRHWLIGRDDAEM